MMNFVLKKNKKGSSFLSQDNQTNYGPHPIVAFIRTGNDGAFVWTGIPAVALLAAGFFIA